MGESNRVRCGNCEFLQQRKFCGAQGGKKINRKKLHECGLFEERKTTSPPPDRYVPANAKEKAKKARSMMRKLVAVGAQFHPDGTITFEDFKMTADGSLLQRQQVEIPKTTANASVIGTEPMYDPSMTDSRKSGNE